MARRTYRRVKKYKTTPWDVLGDVVMVALTRGLWLLWMGARWVLRR